MSGLVAMVGLLGLGVPIAVVLAAVALVLIVAGGDAVLLQSFPQQFYSGLESYGLLALPLFILLGEVMHAGGSGRRLMGLALALIGRQRGGLAYVNLFANVMLAAILGSTVAQLTVMSRLAVPEMERAGYPRDVAVAITAAGALLAPIIPPSMLLILYGVVAQVPIGDLFVAGIVPGLLIAAGFALVLARMARQQGFPRSPPRSRAERLALVRAALPSTLIPALIVGAILSGLATPTEAAALAVLLALALGLFVHGDLRWSEVPGLFARAATGSAVVLVLIASAQVLAWVLAYGSLPGQIGALLAGATTSPLVFLLLLNLLLLALGMVMDPIPALILVVPVLLPVATGQFGIDPVQFGIIVCVNLAMGLLTPPVGAGIFMASMLTGVRAERIARLLLPFLAAAFAVLLALSAVPALSTGLLALF